MHESLLEILREPATLAKLDLTVSRSSGGDIDDGELRSSKTGAVYPIRRGIPRFVADSGYADNFGQQWNLFRKTQLDSSTGARVSESRFDAETGWKREQLDGKLVLDAGCGAGRFAEVAAARGARVVALDMSSAVDAAADTLRRFPRAEVVQASLLEPPFAPRTFDLAYSIGVMQHTPDPVGGIQTIVALVKAGGHFAFTIYARKPWTKLNGKYVVRHITRHISNERLLRGIEKTMPVVFPVADTLFRLPVVRRVARFVLPVALYPERTEFTSEQRYQESILDTFDMLAPRFDSPMTWQEVESALRATHGVQWAFGSKVPIVVIGRC